MTALPAASWTALHERIFDTLLALAAPLRPGSASVERIVVVDIDAQSLAAYGGWPWPWPRSRIADLVEAIGHSGAAAVATDIMFEGPDAKSSRLHWLIVSALKSAARTSTPGPTRCPMATGGWVRCSLRVRSPWASRSIQPAPRSSLRRAVPYSRRCRFAAALAGSGRDRAVRRPARPRRRPGRFGTSRRWGRHGPPGADVGKCWRPRSHPGLPRRPCDLLRTHRRISSTQPGKFSASVE